MFQTDDDGKKKIYQITHFPSGILNILKILIITYIYTCTVFIGKVLKIDQEVLSSLDDGKNKKEKKSKPMTFKRLTNRLNLYTPHIIFRRTHWNLVEKTFVPESEILFFSNALTPGMLRIMIIYMFFYKKYFS
jgi:hypothetical protein